MPAAANPYFEAVRQGVQDADRHLDDVKVEFGSAPSDFNVPETVATLETLLTKDVDALAVVGYDPGLAPVLEAALNDGKPVVFMDAEVPELGDRTTLVATGNRRAGRRAGQFIARSLSGEGKVGFLVGIPADPLVLERTAGAQEVLNGTEIQVVAKLPTDCKRDRGVSATEDMLTAHPDIDLIYSACADPILGAIQAAENLGARDLKLVGFDAQPEEIAAIKAGSETASVAQFPQRMGRIGVEKALQWLKDGATPADIDTGVEIVTKKNVTAFARGG